VDYAYQARTRFPDRPVFLTGEIIHNPHVNDQLRSLGIRFLSDSDEDASRLGPDDVVILPAFGVTIATLRDLGARGCTLVDTTCGSVLNVWKNVKRYAQDGFTSVIHGKYWHEETQATASQALQYANGHYLVVYDQDEASFVCEYIRRGGSTTDFLARFGTAVSPGFSPDRQLDRIGLANQTTMLSSESVAIGEQFRDAMRDRYGEAELPQRFRAFDTICSATQDRQDAVLQLLDQEPLDLMLILGGYNSSNTCNLARICDARLPAYHITNPECLVSREAIRFKPVGAAEETVASGWLPAAGSVRLGLTAGASTPDNLVECVIRTVDEFCNGPRG
jgi:4-hydroxy-3-methylbut-2-en-1-yl diphosphate reductase